MGIASCSAFICVFCSYWLWLWFYYTLWRHHVFIL